MAEAEFTIVIAGENRADITRLISVIQATAESLFEDETMDHGRPMTMLISKNKWINK